MTNEVAVPAFRRPPDLPNTCSDEALLDAVVGYLSGMDIGQVAKLLHQDKIDGWRKHLECNWLSKPGWRFLTEQMKEIVRVNTQTRITRIMGRCFNLIDERLERGDPVYSLEGEVIGYRAVRVKDIAGIAAQMVDRSLELDKRTGSREKDEGDKPLTLNDLASLLKRETELKQIHDAKDVTAESQRSIN